MTTPANHELHMLLGEISSDVKHILSKQTDQSVLISALTNRISKLENGRSMIYGAVAVVPAVWSAAVFWLSTKPM